MRYTCMGLWALFVTTFFAFPADVIAKAIKPCSGTNMIEQMRLSSPAVVRRIFAKAAKVRNDGAVFWRVSKDGKPPSYLLGTLHLSDPRISELSKAARTALGEVSVLALEVEDLSQSTFAVTISKASDLILFAGGKKLSDLLSNGELDKAERSLASVGLSNKTVALLKPWIVSLMSGVGACERARVQKGKPVLDMAIAGVARKRAIPVVGLETLRSQLERAAAVDLSQQLKSLRLELSYGDHSDDRVETLVTLYRNRQIGAVIPFQNFLARKAGMAGATFSGFEQDEISARNRAMRTAAMPLLGKGGAFIAVGALHLIGEDGLVALFRQAGYDVTPVE